EKQGSKSVRQLGAARLAQHQPGMPEPELEPVGLENSRRKTRILKSASAWKSYRSMIRWYALDHIARAICQESAKPVLSLLAEPPQERSQWVNVGGQLMPEHSYRTLQQSIMSGAINEWNAVHAFYRDESGKYHGQVLQHAVASLQEMEGGELSRARLAELLTELPVIEQEIQEQMIATRRKDHEHPFRKMLYTGRKEMDAVIGRFTDNRFLQDQASTAAELSVRVKKAKKLLA
ncbi:MAG: hypothetical protein ACKO3B_08485, partial [Bacteroidota bacterium]